jgi:hypothetical protein
LKYRPEYPEQAFSTLAVARDWVCDFANWYNKEHLHSGRVLCLFLLQSGPATGSSGLRQPSCPSAAKLGSGKTVNTMVAIFAGRQCLSYHLSISYIFEIVKQELQK